MTQPPPPSGGMPKWLVILLILVPILGLGCCGGIGFFIYIANRTYLAPAPIILQQAQPSVLEPISVPTATPVAAPYLPPGVSQYPGFTAVYSTGAPDKLTGSALFTGTESISRVTEHYKTTLTAAGWEDLGVRQAVYQTFRKGNTTVSIVTSASEGKTNTVITWVSQD